jgi:predicted MPP superfamily phosphohydrolase
MSRAELVTALEARLGPVHARQRLGLETEHEHELFRPPGSGARKLFHPMNWYTAPTVIGGCLRLCGLHGRAQRNARKIRTVENVVRIPRLPPQFHDFRVLHLSDLHIDASPEIATAIIEAVRPLEYDVCVLTGDYRFRTCGDAEPTVENMRRLRASLTGRVYGVLGNHDSVLMVPEFERMGITMLMNESVTLERDGAALHVAGIDDAHYFGVDNLEKALAAVPRDATNLLLSHTPEVYRQAAHATVDLLLCGHTHGGQICLPGAIPITLDSVLPRRMGSGAWAYRGMTGYTSVGVGSCVEPVRLNCPPAITLHRLRRL